MQPCKPISIHAPREGGDLAFLRGVPFLVPISIHAPREGGDDALHHLVQNGGISIHAPREGGDGVTPPWCFFS